MNLYFFTSLSLPLPPKDKDWIILSPELIFPLVYPHCCIILSTGLALSAGLLLLWIILSPGLASLLGYFSLYLQLLS